MQITHVERTPASVQEITIHFSDGSLVSTGIAPVVAQDLVDLLVEDHKLEGPEVTISDFAKYDYEVDHGTVRLIVRKNGRRVHEEDVDIS